MEKKFLFFFLILDQILRTFCKKCIFTIENPKKNLENFFKNDKTTFRQAKFCLPQIPDFNTACTLMATARKILALALFCHLIVCL